MNETGRPPTYGDTCCAPGCDAPRHPYAKGKRSRFCHAHHLEHERQRYAATEGTAVVAVIPVLTAADVYTRWGKDWREQVHDCDAWYDGRKVIGMVRVNGADEADCFRLTLMDGTWRFVAGDTGLERAKQGF